MHRWVTPAAVLGLSGLVISPNISCPQTPSPLPKAASFPKFSTLPDPFTYLDGTSRVKMRKEWYTYRQ